MTDLTELEQQLKPPTVREALIAVMESVGEVTKGDYNTQQRYNFRGVDRVVNAVSGPLRQHGVLVLPEVLEERLEPFETSKKTAMWRSVVKVKYRFIGPAGDKLPVTVAGEGSDTLDKATSKAMSVAYRTALLQALCLPTGDPDPDTFAPPDEVPHGVPQSKLQTAKRELWELAKAAGMTAEVLSDEFPNVMGKPIGDATAVELDQYAVHLRGGKPEKATRTVRRVQSADLPDDPNEPISDGLVTAINAAFTTKKIAGDARFAYAEGIIGRPIKSTKDLTRAEAKAVIARLDEPEPEPEPEP